MDFLDERAKIDGEFESRLFASNFPLWQTLYGNEEERIERETEFVVPDNERELKQMIEDFKRSQPKDKPQRNPS